MKFAKILPIFLTAVLASCGNDGLYMGDRGLVEDGEKLNYSRIQNVSETVKEEKEGKVKGVNVTSHSHVIVNANYNGQASSQEQWVSALETVDFENKSITMVSNSGGDSGSYSITIVGDRVVFDSNTLDAESAGFDLTLKGFSDLLETSYKQLFSWNFVPSAEDIKKMTDSMTSMYEGMGLNVELSGFEEMMTSMSNDYVMSGDYEGGDFEVGFDTSHTYSLSIKAGGIDVSPTMVFSKMRMVFKDYMCVESYAALTEIFSISVGYEDFSFSMNYNLYTDTYSTYSYF